MIIIGCDFHSSWQMISWLDSETGETGERKLMHATGEARQFYAGLAGAVRVGLESTGNSHWFVDLLTELGHEVWIGDAAQIRASYVRKQKTDRRDAKHILDLLRKDSFPRIWTPSRQERDQEATADPSLQAGDVAGASEERTATSGPEPGHAERPVAMEQKRPEAVAGSAAAVLGGYATQEPAGAVEADGSTDSNARPGGEKSS